MGSSTVEANTPSEIEPGPAPAILPEPKPGTTIQKSRRVLLVDDDATTRCLLRILLEEHREIEVVAEASDGDEAIVLADMYRPDIILMDIQLPHLNGIEATRQIHKNLPQIIIIGISSQYTHYGYNAMMAAGAAAFVQKEDAASALDKTIQLGLQHNKSLFDAPCESVESQSQSLSSDQGSCPWCSSTACRRSMRRSGNDLLHRLVGMFPWRCCGCGGRFYLPKRSP